MIRKLLLLVLSLVLVYIGTISLICYFQYSHLKSDLAGFSSLNSEKYETTFHDAGLLFRDARLIYPIIALNQNLKTKYLKLEKLVEAKPIIDKLTSFDKERSYLVLMQDNAEIRPSGGFWGSYGILKVKDAKITSFTTTNTYDLDLANKGKFTPPDEVKDIIGDEWRFWNANWSPDFKISVEQGLFFYKQIDPNIKFDGVLGPNINYLLSELKITGPVEVPNHDFKIDPENFIKKMIYEPINPALYNAKKDDPNFIFPEEKKSLFSEIAKNILEQAKIQGNIESLGLVTYNALDNKDFLVYFPESGDENLVSSLGWGGRVQSDQNFVMVVDANLGSKLDFYINKKLQIRKIGDGQYEGTLTYQNTYDPNDPTHIIRDYRTLTRIFLPQDSTLVSAAGGQRVAKINSDSEIGSAYINTLLIIEPGESSTFTFRWQVAQKFSGSDLVVEKQSGSGLVSN